MHDDPWARSWRDPSREARAQDREDYGQADYSRDYGYDPETRTGYRRGPDDGYEDRDDRSRRAEASETRREHRSWFGSRHDTEPQDRHDRLRAASDRRIFAVIVERMEHDRRVDTSDVEVAVEDGVVYLSGSTRTREGKRRLEHMSDVDGVRDIVNSIRVRELGR